MEIKIERDGGELREKRVIERRGTGLLEDQEGRDGIGGDVSVTPTARYTCLHLRCSVSSFPVIRISLKIPNLRILICDIWYLHMCVGGAVG